MKIDKNKPLPEHTRLDYNECCALLILKELFPKRYGDLKIKDKPDLQGSQIGVEVTNAIDKKHQEAVSNWVKANYCENEDKKQRYVERMSQCGANYTGGIQAWPGYEPSIKDIYDAVDTKIKKLKRGNYAAFNTYELFIFTEAWLNEKAVQEMSAYFTNNNAFDSYSKIYILEKGYLLFLFDKCEVKLIEINNSEQTDRNLRARHMVELAETE